jgi:hypothetical protein
MAVETIGEAFSLGWHVIARCARGREDGPSSKSSRECTYRRVLDMETLVCTRGRAFPLSRLESRLRCPRCGNRRMVVMFEAPARAMSIKTPKLDVLPSLSRHSASVVEPFKKWL